MLLYFVLLHWNISLLVLLLLLLSSFSPFCFFKRYRKHMVQHMWSWSCLFLQNALFNWLVCFFVCFVCLFVLSCTANESIFLFYFKYSQNWSVGDNNGECMYNLITLSYEKLRHENDRPILVASYKFTGIILKCSHFI